MSHSSPQQHAQVVRLVGRKCIVKCLLNGLETDALWDTGAQVSIISHSWLNQCLPGCDIRDIAELLGMDGLKLKAANGTDLPYEGWVELTFNLIEDDSDHTVTVPFLIAKDFLDMPIVGFNVIEEITQQFDRGPSARINGSLVDVLSSSLTGVGLIVRKMLVEEAESFSKTDDDVGRAEELQVDINLTDSVPVQRTYTAIPRPLYAEIKQYVEDLLNRGWIQKSKSAYSSPVVCVRKKDESLRLCVEYRELNSKAVRDSHLLPRIQDALESLGGNQWFSLLDQGKAYHQGFVSSPSRHKTAFCYPLGTV